MNSKYSLFQELILNNYSTFINSVELFKHLPDTVIVQLTSAIKSEIFMAGDEVVNAGSRGDALYFISSGTVAVYTAMGREVRINVIVALSVFPDRYLVSVLSNIERVGLPFGRRKLLRRDCSSDG